MNEYTRYWFEKALQWADERWNEEYALLEMPVDRKLQGEVEQRYGVRASVWYATGLLIRQNEGDIKRACRIIETIMTYQFDEPDAVYHGTFFRYYNEPHPRNDTTVWRGYDPNWREFICTVFIILLQEFGELLPTNLQDKMKNSILLAAEGAYERKVEAEYTNISLMSAFLLDYAGEIFDRPVWREYALSQAHAINNLFNRYKTFHEYNSPTYYGVDFYALGLWRKFGSSEVYREFGATMEAELWRDTAQFYHADMRNMCGPFDRSYGMDMTEYIAVVALWIASAIPSVNAPLPDVDHQFDHAHDYFFMPLVALVETKPPDDVLSHLTEFQGERFLERIIEPNREVTAWLSKNIMIGAESDKVNVARSDQFHPGTVHWLTPDGSIGWIRTRCASLIQANAKSYELVLSSDELVKYSIEIYAKDVDETMITATQWKLPNLTVRLAIDEETPLKIKQTGDVLSVRFDYDRPVKLTFSLEGEV